MRSSVTAAVAIAAGVRLKTLTTADPNRIRSVWKANSARERKISGAKRSPVHSEW